MQGQPQALKLRALPELDVEDGRLREVRHTLYVDHLLHLRAPVHRRVHGLGLQAQMCPCQGGHCNVGTVSPGPRGERRSRGGSLSTKPGLLVVGKTLNTGDPTRTHFSVALTGHV